MQGAYQGFFDNNIQADWVHLNHIDEYDFLYLPFPVMLTQKTADKLRLWVDSGGTLVSEGCPGYFGDRGHVGTIQPNLGLAELFGVQESYVEFTPDLLDNLKFNLSGAPVWGGLFLQVYQPMTGKPVGWYEDGRVAVVDNTFGKGRTRLIGTMPSSGYAMHQGDRSAAFFAELLKFAGKQQHVRCSEPRVTARIHDGVGGIYLWVANPTRQPRPVHLELGEAWGTFSNSSSLWGAEASVTGSTITLTVEARNVTVIVLLSS
jgi:beta-galactosidase